MNDSRTLGAVIEALQRASGVQLHQLRALIDQLLADPARAGAAVARLHLGQSVQFVDFRTGQLRLGKLIARHGTDATILEHGVHRTWKLACVAIEPAAIDPGSIVDYEPPPEPARGPREEFSVGDKVTFDDRTGKALVGVIGRINRRTASIETMDGHKWRVGFAHLRHVLDV